MTRFGHRIFPQMLLALAALSVALPLALAGCGGGEQSPPPAASPLAPTVAAASTGSPTTDPPTEAPAVEEDRSITVYSGRSQSLVHPILEAFGKSTGIEIRVKYAGSAAIRRHRPRGRGQHPC